MAALTLSIVDGEYAVGRMEPDASVPDWLPATGFVSVTRTAQELSIVCIANAVPAGERAERGFCLLKIEGPLDFYLTGILSTVAGPLADAAIPIFALSTFDTDYVLVLSKDLQQAVTALEAAGHRMAGRH